MGEPDTAKDRGESALFVIDPDLGTERAKYRLPRRET